MLKAWLQTEHPEINPAWVEAHQSGANTWAMMIRASTELFPYDYDLLLFDATNDGKGDIPSLHVLEAFIRRVITDMPTARIGFYNWFTVANRLVDASVNSPVLPDHLGDGTLEALIAHYGLWLIDVWDALQAAVAGGTTLSTLYADNSHPSATGHTLILNQMTPGVFSGGAVSDTLPARLYAESEAYENTPTRRAGTANDGTTGTWTTAGSRISSSEAGATVTFNNVTCSSVGVYPMTSDVYYAAQISVDGGAFRDIQLGRNGTLLSEGLAEHDIVLKVVSDAIIIDEFWAI